jgi:hypothetical protein
VDGRHYQIDRQEIDAAFENRMKNITVILLWMKYILQFRLPKIPLLVRTKSLTK